jgi:hypothetical protein
MRAHFYRLLVDPQGNMVPNVQVRVLEPGTTTLISEPVYADDTTPTPRSNPFEVPDGQVNFYLDRPRRVRLGVTAPDQPEAYYENVDVLASETMIRGTSGILYAVQVDDETDPANPQLTYTPVES